MTPTTPTQAGWPRWRLLATLSGLAATVLALMIGLALAIAAAFTSTTPSPAPAVPPAGSDAVRGDVHRDQVAAAPMLRVTADAASTPQVSTRIAPTLEAPTPTGVGPAGVVSGFPHTPEGALAQLAAIEATVVEAMSIPVAHQVHAAWSLPGAVKAEEWVMTRHVQAFLTTLGDQGNTKDDSVLVAASPAAGQIKGTDGPDWVLACVLLDVRATVVTTARIGYGHCERMAWHHDRWLIAPGTPPVPAPSTWPGSDLALDAGWRTWTTAGVGDG